MKPFLLLATREDDAAADNEYDAFLAFTGLTESSLRRVRLERRGLGTVDLEEWSGIFLGGGPFNSADPEHTKSTVQQRVEADLAGLLDAVVEADFPFLGACYGIGTLGSLRGGVVDRTYGEPIGAVAVTLTEDGLADPLLAGLPEGFWVFLGHKEAVSRLPEGATVLASSATCPVQAFRLGRRVYATQFHPELDVEGICLRIDVYRDHGYYEPGRAEEMMALARVAVVTEPPTILARFVDMFGC